MTRSPAAASCGWVSENNREGDILSEEMMTCPICGQKFPADKYEILDNGNPACPECAYKEHAETDRQKD